MRRRTGISGVAAVAARTTTLLAGASLVLIAPAFAETPTSAMEVLERRYLEGIRDRVRIALEYEARDEFCEAAEFEVEATPDGVVTLDGRVCVEASLERAARIAQHQVGVTDVVVRLRVDRAARDPEAETTPRRAVARRNWLAEVDPQSDDEEMSEDLAASLAAYMGPTTEAEDRFFCDPRVVGERWSVELDVDDETLRVSGAVEEEATRARIRSWARLVLQDSKRIQATDLDLSASD